MIKPLEEYGAFTCTFNTTEECNLRCKYCYEINKRPRILDVQNAYYFIDHIFTDPDPAGLLDDIDTRFRNSYKKGLIFDFIGGDSLMNISLLDKIFRYTLKNLYTINEGNTPLWRNRFLFALSTNGTLFEYKNVRDFCEEYKDIFEVGVSIDGCPEIHDLNRIFTDGRGSMNTILKNWDWYKSTFPIASLQTKATSNKESIPYLYESLKFMHETLGLTYINQNFIMEDMHLKAEDLEMLEVQLDKCVDYVLQHQDDLYWSMFSEEQFAKAQLSTGEKWTSTGWCGSGAMPALSVDGNIYPCIRWLPHTQVEKSKFIVGTAKEGFVHKDVFKKVREGAYRANCTTEDKCKSCNIESSCAYCIGGSYSEFGEFKRTTYSCEVNKLLVKYAKKYWENYYGRK